MKQKSLLNVTVEDAFEMGKLCGKRDVLHEFKELSIVDPTFHSYVKARLKSLDDTSELLKRYEILLKVRH